MRPTFFPKLVNGPLGDPALYVGFLHRRRALLFDAGELHAFATRKLLKISHLFISHAHMDHFIGFDHLVRLMLGRPKRLKVFGPAPLINQIASRLASYSWNLVGRYSERLVLEVTQLKEGFLERAVLDCREGFQEPASIEVEPFDGWLSREDTYGIRATLLDHRIDSMAFCLEEPIHLQVLKGRLKPMGLAVGPWLTDLKEAIIRREEDEAPVNVTPADRGPIPLGWLRKQLIRVMPGQRIGYVVDVAYSRENHARIVSLIKGVDLLFIEVAFLNEDRRKAGATAHLTAYQAGRIAAEAGVKKVIPFHFSPKYSPNGETVAYEVQETFKNFTLRN
jgi:ribonuclease Z